MAQFEEKPVSSTRIRTALEGGDIPAANAMSGCPTPSGSRCSTVQVWATRWGAHHQPAVSRGLSAAPQRHLYHPHPHWRFFFLPSGLRSRPTVNDDATKVTHETFIPGFSGDLYGTRPCGGVPRLPAPAKSLIRWTSCGPASTMLQSAQEYFA